MRVLGQSSIHTISASLFEMEVEPNLLDWNINELERELEQEGMKCFFNTQDSNYEW